MMYLPNAVSAGRGLMTPSGLVFVMIAMAIMLIPAHILGGGTMTGFASLSLLIFGLPHGSFDLALVRRSSPAQLSGLTALYLGVTLAMYVIWRGNAVVALVLFYALSVIHFGEDWKEIGSAFLAQGVALAVLTTPALSHRTTLASLFVLLTDDPNAAILVDLLILLAPVTMSAATVGLFTAWRSGERDIAFNGVIAVLAMILLPPVVGFALFFCLLHSPKQFGAALAELNWSGVRQWGGVVAPLTFAGFGITALVYAFIPTINVSDRFFSASFMTLSMLTLPHMAVPHLIGLWQRKHNYQFANLT